MNATKIAKRWPKECEAKNYLHLHHSGSSKGPKFLKLCRKEQKSLCKGPSTSASDSASVSVGNQTSLYRNRWHQNWYTMRNQTRTNAREKTAGFSPFTLPAFGSWVRWWCRAGGIERMFHSVEYTLPSKF